MASTLENALCPMPSSWLVERKDAKTFMYAFHLPSLTFHPQPDPSAPRAYWCYLSDLKSVWVHSASGHEFAEKARKLGISRVDRATLSYLAKEISSAFENKESIAFEPDADEGFVVSVQLPSSLAWEMRLQKMDTTESAAFLATLNVHQFANHSYLAYKVSQLEKALRAKDKYTLYLEENYKTVNGTALMDKYKRQNADEAVLLKPYSRSAFDSHVEEQYGSLARRLEASPSSWSSLFYDVVSSVFHDAQTWVAGAWILGHQGGTSIKQEDKSRGPGVKKEPKIKSEPMDEQKVKSENVKLEPLPSGGATSSEGGSPSKRQRIGLLGRKRPLSGAGHSPQGEQKSPSESDTQENQRKESTSNIQSSPVKRKRVGDLRRR